MTRAEKVAEAQRLRAQGLRLREIAERMGFKTTTVHAWLSDPDRSKERARKDSYRGICERCGGPTNGSDGPGRAATVCRACIDWTEQDVIDAMHRWADAHGGVPPTAIDWRYASDGHPCSSASVVGRIGWNELLLRAGFTLRCDRRPETQAWIEAQVRAGRPTREIADALGVTPANIHLRLRRRGLRLTDLRGDEPREERIRRFCELWNARATVDEIAQQMGIGRKSVYMKVNALRARGYDLPRRYVRRTTMVGA